MGAMDRLYSWVALAALSAIILTALVDQLPAGDRGGKENYVIATACISLIFGAIFTAGNVIDSLRNKIIGNIFENGVASFVMALWIVAISFIQNPQNNIATSISGNNEVISYANLYFFSWLTFLASVFTVGVTFRDNFHFGPKFNQWMLLFTASTILASTSVNLRNPICDNDQGSMACDRTKYAIGIGAIGIAFSIIAVFASVMDRISGLLELTLTGLSTVLYFFGVVFLTSVSGPASTMGNMYFSVWGGCFCSFMLLLGTLFPEGSVGDKDGENYPNEEQI